VHISERCVQRALCDRALVPVLSRVSDLLQWRQP
jgi:hypothetical protein